MEDIHEVISVIAVFDADIKVSRPVRFRWRGRVYKVQEVALHLQKQIKGRLHHIYAVSCGTMECVLDLDTLTLIWTLDSTQLPG